MAQLGYECPEKCKQLPSRRRYRFGRNSNRLKQFNFLASVFEYKTSEFSPSECALVECSEMVEHESVANSENIAVTVLEQLIVEPVTVHEQLIVEPVTALEQLIVDPVTVHEQLIVEPVTALEQLIVEPVTIPEALINTEPISEESLTKSEYTRSSSANLRDAIVSHDTIKATQELTNVSIDNELEATTWTPLAFASLHGDIPIVTAILLTGARIDGISGALRLTALHAASMNDQADVVKILIENGADTEITDLNGRTARQTAIKWNHTKVMDVFNKTVGELKIDHSIYNWDESY